jgi:hypothetical protein
MAYVSVRTVPFERGAEALAPAVAEVVASLAAGLATDCFLTAQAIGHVEPGATGEGDDTLAAHRLARARADHVQRLLGEKGLPASAVASVWDYQFLVREARVTLWVFNLREGEDCQGEPLPAGKSPAVASAERKVATKKVQPALLPAAGPGLTAAAAAATAKATPAVRAEEKVATADVPTPPAAVAAEGPPAAPAVPRDGTDQRVAAAAAPTSSSRPSPRVMTPAQPPTQAPPPVEASPPTVAAMSPGARDVGGVAAVAQAAGVASPSAAVDPGPALAAVSRPSSSGAGAGAMAPPSAADAEIVFDSNSSFLPRGASKELERLVAGLPKAKGYEVELTATVGAAADAGSTKARDPAEAARYDRWLAERRLGRVAEWIEKNAPVRELSVRRGFAENDPSRRIIVRVRPVP